MGDVTPHPSAILRFASDRTVNAPGLDPNFRFRVDGTLFLEAVGVNLYLRSASDKSVLGLTAAQLRDELSVYSKTQVDSLHH